MPGTGARKGWKTKNQGEEVAAAARLQAKAFRRIARRLEAQEATRTAGFVPGLQVNLQKIDEEYVPDLKDLQGRLGILQQMGNDGKIAAQLRANKLPLISAVRWRAEGGTQEMRDLVDQNILRHGDPRYWCETSWTQRLMERLEALNNGFALHGKTWDVVDGYRIFRRLTYLHPKSLGGPIGPWEWSPDGTRLVAIHRRYKRPDLQVVNDERIPIEDIDATVWWLTGENWEGNALIRPMYGAWKRKDLSTKIAMIALMNGGVGIPMATMGPGDGPAQQGTLRTIAQDLRGGSKERQFILLANGQKVEFLTTNGQIVDARPIIQEQNLEIASAGATDFMQSGQTASGSRAGGSVMMVSYMQQLDATRQWLQEQINHGAGYLMGQVEELIYNNFSDVKECPQIIGSSVSPSDQLDNLSLLGDLTTKGVIPRSLKTANAALDRLGYPLMTQEEYDISVGGRSVVDIAGEPGPTHPTDVPPVPPGEKPQGRPNSTTPIDKNEPRNDKMGRQFGLVEKKTPNGSPRPRSAASCLWLKSTPA
jgi:hypothetical protein